MNGPRHIYLAWVSICMYSVVWQNTHWFEMQLLKLF